MSFWINAILLVSGTNLRRGDGSRVILNFGWPHLFVLNAGKFQSLATLAITTNAKDAYRLVLVDTPLGKSS